MVYIIGEREVMMLNLNPTLALNEAHAKMAHYQQDAAIYRALPHRSLRSRAARLLLGFADRLEPQRSAQLQLLHIKS